VCGACHIVTLFYNLLLLFGFVVVCLCVLCVRCTYLCAFTARFPPLCNKCCVCVCVFYCTYGVVCVLCVCCVCVCAGVVNNSI